MAKRVNRDELEVLLSSHGYALLKSGSKYQVKKGKRKNPEFQGTLTAIAEWVEEKFNPKPQEPEPIQQEVEELSPLSQESEPTQQEETEQDIVPQAVAVTAIAWQPTEDGYKAEIEGKLVELIEANLSVDNWTILLDSNAIAHDVVGLQEAKTKALDLIGQQEKAIQEKISTAKESIVSYQGQNKEGTVTVRQLAKVFGLPDDATRRKIAGCVAAIGGSVSFQGTRAKVSFYEYDDELMAFDVAV